MKVLESASPEFSLSFMEMIGAVLCAFGGRALALLSPWRIQSVLKICRIAAKPATFDEAFAARNAVITASLACAGERCLPRSIAAALYCRLKGTWPTWCIGARTDPFEAHAWIEVDGTPVGEHIALAPYARLVTVSPT